MKFIEKTNSKLKITVVPLASWLFSIGLLALIGYIFQSAKKDIVHFQALPLTAMLIIGVVLALGVAEIFAARVAVLSLDKSDDSLVIRWIGILPKEQLKYKLSSIVQAGCMREGSRDSYSNVLRTISGEEMPIPIICGWVESHSIADHINIFIGAKQINITRS